MKSSQVPIRRERGRPARPAGASVGSDRSHPDGEGSTAPARIEAAALNLLREGGPGALTTRAVCELAEVTAPTLYHHFGDKEGLLRHVATSAMQEFFGRKQRAAPSEDARRDVGRGWDDWIEFAIENTHLVRAIRAEGASAEPLRLAAEAIALGRLERLARTTPLAVDPQTGAQVLVAAANSVVQLLLDGVAAAEVRRLSFLLKDAVIEAVAPTLREPVVSARTAERSRR